MQMFKQHGYLWATFGVFLVIGGVLFSLSYCGGKTDAKMDANNIELKELESRSKELKKQIEQLEVKEREAMELATEYKFKLEIQIYKYDSLRKAKINIPYRNLNVSSDSLRSIWAEQIR